MPTIKSSTKNSSLKEKNLPDSNHNAKTKENNINKKRKKEKNFENKKTKRIVCVSGFGTSAAFMKWQMKNWIAKLTQIEFLFYEPKYKLPAEFTGDPAIIKFHHKLKNKDGSDVLVGGHYDGFTNLDQIFPFEKRKIIKIPPESLENLVDFLNECGTVDGILGFSQGGFVLYSFFTALENFGLKEKLNPNSVPNFGIFICGHPCVGNHELKVPSLHLIGKIDRILRTAVFATMRYRDPEIVFYEEGHKIPLLTQKLILVILEFIAKCEEKGYKEKIENGKIKSLVPLL